ncbi:MAG: chorismate mutase [Alphaproteobacteria bacterium]
MSANKQPPPTLDDVRGEIDQIDAELHALIIRRTDLASHVWSAKRAAPKTALAALRPGREAHMLRALAQRHTGAMPLATLWRIWRAFIIANIRVQAPFDVYLSNEAMEGEIWDLARRHFGFETKISATPDPVAAAQTGAGVAVLPLVQGASWGRQVAKGGVRVFAALPQIGPAGQVPRAIVVGDAGIAATGGDITLAMLATGVENVGNTIIVQGQSRAVIYQIDGSHDSQAATIVALGGFLDGTENAPRTQVWQVNGSPTQAVILGAYAAPVSEPDHG